VPVEQDEEPDDEVMDDENDVDVEEQESQDDEEDDLEDVAETPKGPVRKGNKRASASTSRKKQAPAAPIPTAAAAGLFTPKHVIPRKVHRPNPPASGLPSAKIQTPQDKMHTRGVDEWGRGARGGGLENRIKDLFGPSFRDLQPVIMTRDRCIEQHTLPSRKHHVGRSYFAGENAREREIQKLREWYLGPGSECISRGQQSKGLTKEEGLPYLAHDGPPSLNLLLGASKNPQLYSLKAGSSLSTAAPFKANMDRRGWVINLGSKIQDSQWAPVEEGSTQYLAVAVEQKPPSARQHKPLENPDAPAFSATAKFPASIQIWSFQSIKNGLLDQTIPPRLEVVVCTDWGAPKQLRWCPFAVTDSTAEDAEATHLGLLATRWSDGKVRILDISYANPDPNSSEPHFINYSRSAFEVEIPNTVPTCIHWLSGTSLAVATAAGTLSVWTLTRPGVFPPSDKSLEERHNPRPWLHEQIADTFILTLTSGFPSRPQFISITTADGYARLVDLRAPVADTANTSRGRIFAIAQAWHEHTQSFIMPDEVLQLRSNTIRRYYSNIHNIRSDAQIVFCATSPMHPCVLVGCADGRVSASNPIARVLNYKEIPWQQTWFKHEWRPSVDKLALKVKGHEEQNTTQKGGSSNQPPSTVSPEVLSQPLARMTEGYRVQKNVLQPTKPGQSAQSVHTKDFIKPITIFEEPSCVTTLAWNPNLKFGTWAVAGLGDGLLRVEDLGV
jgi:transcription factor C subunit 6